MTTPTSRDLDCLHRDAFENASVGMAYASADGQLLAVNNALARLLGVTRDEVLMLGLDASLHPQDRLPDRSAWDRLISGEIESSMLEQLRYRSDGTVIRTRLRRSAIRDSRFRVEFVASLIEEVGIDDRLYEAQLQAQAERLELQASELQEQAAALELANTELVEALAIAEQARRAAEQAEAEQRAILEGLRDVVLVLDVDGRYIKIPPTSPDALYAPAADLIGRRMHDVMPASIAEGFLEVIRRALELRESIKTEYSLSINGRERSFAGVVSPITSDRVVWVSRDVTDERAAAESLRLSEQRYHLLFDGNPMPMWVYDRESLRFLDVNDAAVHGYGYSRAEFANMTIADIRPEADIAMLRRSVAGSPRARHTKDGWRHRRKDGSIIEVEITTHPFRHQGHDGELVLAHDVSKRRRAEEELRATTSLLQAVVDDSPLAIVTVGLDLAVTRWNPAAERMLGWTASEMEGRPYDSIIPAEREERFPQSWEQALAGGDFCTLATFYRRKDSTRVDVDISLAALHDQEGKVTGVMLILADTTAQRKLEAQLRQSQKMEVVGQLAGGVAHDFNNLLTAINGYSDLLLADAEPGDERYADLLEIKQAANRAAALTRQLLAFSRQQVVRTRPVSLNTVVESLRNMLRRLVREDIGLELELDPSTCIIDADPGQLEQVIMNLVLNARDAIEGPGSITIETTNVEIGEPAEPQFGDDAIRPGRYAVMRVADSGTGMTPATIGRLFVPFFTTKEIGKGTGLGLATVYGIVTQANGHIACTSTLGSGSTFTVHFPSSDSRHASDEPVSANPALVTEAQSETILLVEDEETVRMVAGRILRKCGYTVLEASGGEAALALVDAGAELVDLLITDLVMPGMSGSELVTRLRDRTPGLPVLYVSGYSRDAIDRKIEFSDGNAYLEKPFTAKSLSVSVKQLLAPAAD